ncbi:MAG: M48 family metalloprotease [Thermodesulfobacteriota bacterium]
MLKRNFLNLHIIILCLLLIAGPVMTPQQLRAKPFSIGKEKEIGEKMQSLLRREFKLIDDPDVAQYINDLGRQVLAVAGPQYFNYQFFVIDSKDFNAFAAPSGLIFIHSGLITGMTSENELLGVIAHEISHVTSRHLADRINKAAKVNIGTVALILAGIALGSSGEGELSEAVVAGAMATGAAMNLKFSRANEEEADRLAFSWMIKMNRNPESLLSMLSKMRRISILKMGNIPPYLLTHPNPAQRMGYIQDLLNTYDKELPPATTSDFNFQRIRYRIIANTDNGHNLIPRLLKKTKENKDPELFLKLGLAQISIHEGNYNIARKHLSEVIKKYPHQAILKSDLASTYLSEGKPEKALAIFSEALHDDPDCAFTIFHMARALDQTNQTDQAIKFYEDLLLITPTFARTHYYLGQSLSKIGQEGLGHYHTGLYNWLEGNTPNAKYHLGKALKKLPKDSIYMEKSKNMLEKIAKLEKL